MTATAVVRSPDQRMAALILANEIRCARARMKRELRAGTVDAVALVAEPPSYLRTMKLEKFLVAIPGLGRVKARRMMNVARISDAKTVGGLSDRQRAELVAQLVSRGVA